MPTLNASTTPCTDAQVAAIPNGGTLRINALDAALVPIGTPVFLYQKVTYEFRNSVAVPGQIALWRKVNRKGTAGDEELVAPFSPDARFRFYIDDAAQAVDNPPIQTQLNRLTGIEIVMDGISERPNADGTREKVPYSTSVFFKNRM
jgi:hypothetical protein